MSDVILPAAQAATAATNVGDVRTGMRSDALRQAIEDHLRYSLGRPAALLEPKHYYRALALAVRDRMQQRWIETTQTYLDLSRKVACYLSAEFLLGPHLGNNLLNLQIEEEARAALTALGQDFDEVLACEEEPGLGNGGLGRLAACYLDSLATLQRPAVGYGIRYEFGIFDQEIRDGWQVEKTDNWLADGNTWEIVKPELNYRVGWGGRTESYIDERGRYRVRWIPQRAVKGVYYGTPFRAMESTPATPSRCGAPGPSSHWRWTRSTPATTTWRSMTRWCPKPSPRCSTPTMSRKSANNCGWPSSISLCPVRCRTSCICSRTSPACPCRSCPTAWRFNSTTPTSRSPWPS
ncbi:hypothetical protein MSHO_38450 [Mycobacterium shottsii]|uniref:Alpha-1,4 glucan phosphorylase n=1 Tax=Mycobacterium shottsii TaxID=133549 RepID=A0A7I7LFW1_9MYCO|nr:hypothetical protein MSHO_38450 [Mycobacterium shottsii]